MSHADAQHRATSDPSEGHAVKTGEREVGALLVLDGEGDGAMIKGRSNDKFGAFLGRSNRQGIISLVLIKPSALMVKVKAPACCSLQGCRSP